MGRTLNEVMAGLSPERRERIEAQVIELRVEAEGVRVLPKHAQERQPATRPR